MRFEKWKVPGSHSRLSWYGKIDKFGVHLVRRGCELLCEAKRRMVQIVFASGPTKIVVDVDRLFAANSSFG